MSSAFESLFYCQFLDIFGIFFVASGVVLAIPTATLMQRQLLLARENGKGFCKHTSVFVILRINGVLEAPAKSTNMFFGQLVRIFHNDRRDDHFDRFLHVS